MIFLYLHLYILYHYRKSLDYYNKALLRLIHPLPKVEVQVESIVDVPDDGYRWRKSGQRPNKGNLMPRYLYLFFRI